MLLFLPDSTVKIIWAEADIDRCSAEVDLLQLCSKALSVRKFICVRKFISKHLLMTDSALDVLNLSP